MLVAARRVSRALRGRGALPRKAVVGFAGGRPPTGTAGGGRETSSGGSGRACVSGLRTMVVMSRARTQQCKIKEREDRIERGLSSKMRQLGYQRKLGNASVEDFISRIECEVALGRRGFYVVEPAMSRIEGAVVHPFNHPSQPTHTPTPSTTHTPPPPRPGPRVLGTRYR